MRASSIPVSPVPPVPPDEAPAGDTATPLPTEAGSSLPRAKHLPLREPDATTHAASGLCPPAAAPREAHPQPLRVPATPPDLVPARMINEVLYCERLFYLEWAQGEFEDNHFTVDGRTVHRRADSPGGSLPPQPASAPAGNPPGETSVPRAPTGPRAKDGEDEAPAEPEDDRPYKARSVWLTSERLGITAKIDVVEGEGSGRVFPIEYKRGSPPDVPEGAYLPERAQLCAQVLLLREHGYSCDEAALYFAAARRRVPIAIDDALIATTLGAAARARELAALIITARDGTNSQARLPNTSHVSIFGSVQVSTQAMRAMLERDIPLFFFTTGAYFLGRLVSHDSNNIELRIAQHRAAADPTVCLALARRVVASKIRNSRTLLRRNLTEPNAVVLSELEQSAKRAETTDSLESLLGVEGAAARAYFGAFSGMLTPQARALGFDLDGRNRRPPKDPVNALLSFLYALLAKDCTRALLVAGLDPLLGFYHQPRFGRPALALDLMEEFRPLLADSAVITICNTQVVTPTDFHRTPAAAALTPAARKRVLSAYERRMDQLVTHPVFGYRISYRRILEVQARLLGRFLTGEIQEYPEFRTR